MLLLINTPEPQPVLLPRGVSLMVLCDGYRWPEPSREHWAIIQLHVRLSVRTETVWPEASWQQLATWCVKRVQAVVLAFFINFPQKLISDLFGPWDNDSRLRAHLSQHQFDRGLNEMHLHMWRDNMDFLPLQSWLIPRWKMMKDDSKWNLFSSLKFNTQQPIVTIWGRLRLRGTI